MSLFKKTSGYTLIEISITMAIFSLLIVGLMKGLNNTHQYRSNIREEITTIQNLFANARNFAITSSAVETEGSTTPIVVPYGIYIELFEDAENKNKTEFSLFADTNKNGIFDASDDITLSKYSAFEKGIAQGVDTKITLLPNSGSLTDQKIIQKYGGNAQNMTFLFAPLDASPTILFNNISSNNSYQGFEINFFETGLIEEEILFNKISRFFERVKICPAKDANDCSSRQP